MVRILHVVDSLNPGGLENGIVNVSRALAEPDAETGVARFQISACCLTDRGAFAERMPDPALVFALEKPPGFQFSAVRQLAKVIDRIEPDIVHTHDLGPLIYTVPATRFGRKVPIVHGEHTALDEEHLSWKRLMQRKILYRAAAVVHTVSPSLLENVRQAGLNHRYLCSVRNGVDTQRFQPLELDKEKARVKAGLKGIPERAFLIGIVARLAPVKGHIPLIEAVEELVASGMESEMERELHLVVAGAVSTDGESIVERIKNSACADRIHWLGHCEKPEHVYSALDAMVAPSALEGLSNSVLESMACGLPVLASSACGNSEVIRDRENGWLRDLSTPSNICSELRTLLAMNPEDLRRMGNEARHTVDRDFSLATMVAGYEQLYSAVSGRA